MMKECPACAALTELAGRPRLCRQHGKEAFTEAVAALPRRQRETQTMRPGKTARDRAAYPPQERERKRAERAAMDRERALRRGSGQKKAGR